MVIPKKYPIFVKGLIGFKLTINIYIEFLLDTNPIKNIVDTIYDYFKDNLILGEELLCEIDNNSVYEIQIFLL